MRLLALARFLQREDLEGGLGKVLGFLFEQPDQSFPAAAAGNAQAADGLAAAESALPFCPRANRSGAG